MKAEAALSLTASSQQQSRGEPHKKGTAAEINSAADTSIIPLSPIFLERVTDAGHCVFSPAI